MMNMYSTVYTAVSFYQAIRLDERHSMSADVENTSAGTLNFMYYSA